jgi:hypothetical protein
MEERITQLSHPRLRRLHADLAGMIALMRASDLIVMSHSGNPPDRYVVTYACRGLSLPAPGADPVVVSEHVAEFYLHREYPRRPPQIIWRTPIFHPNILAPDRGGGVCIGSWTPSEMLADLVLRIGEMIQYRLFNADDLLDREAASWAVAHASELPVDKRPLVVYGL